MRQPTALGRAPTVALATALSTALSLAACSADGETGSSASAAAVACVDVVHTACGVAQSCVAELPALVQAALPSPVVDAIENCEQTLDAHEGAILAGCEVAVANNPHPLIRYLLQTDIGEVLECVEQLECSSGRLVEIGGAVAALASDPRDPQPLLEALLGECAGQALPPDPGDPDPQPDPQPDPPDPGDPPPPPSSLWDITLIDGWVNEKKVDGKNWDCCLGSNKPDLKVILSTGGATYESNTVTGFEVAWNQLLAPGVEQSAILSQLTIELVDVDPLSDDTAGTCQFQVDASALGSGPVTFECPRDESTDKAGWEVRMSFAAAL